MSDAIDKYLHEVLKKIHPAERRKKISEELTDHILSAYEDYLTQNYSEDEALKKALSDMGDPLKLGKKLNHTKYSKKIFAFWISPSANGESMGYIAGGGPGLNISGIDKTN